MDQFHLFQVICHQILTLLFLIFSYLPPIRLYFLIIMKEPQQYQQKHALIFPQNVIASQHQLFQSQNFKQYKRLMGSSFPLISQKQLFSCQNISHLLAYGIVIDQTVQNQSIFSLELFKQSINSQVIVFNASWGMFKTDLCILNIVGESSTHSHRSIGGSFGKIYYGSMLQQTFAVKCISFRKNKLHHQAKLLAIKQFFILKIASALHIGPNIKRNMGFDLIMYKDCLQFYMEDCEEIKTLNQKQQKLLYEDLLLLHNFRVVHLDIKPQNLMFSREFNKPVFIDFGLSHIIDCQIGFKTSFKYQGTLEYCSPEMLNAFNSGQKQILDLYYNDVHCLNKTIEHICSQRSQLMINSTLIKQMFLENELWDFRNEKLHIPFNKMLLFSIKYMLFVQQIQSLIKLFLKHQNYINQHLMSQILDFFFELQPAEQLKEFYQNYIKSYKKQSIQYAQLNQIYHSKFLNFKSIKPNQIKKQIFSSYTTNLFNFVADTQTSNMTKANIQCFLKGISMDKVCLLDYFKHYINYIHYSNNTYQVTQREREIMANIFYKKIIKSQDSQCFYKQPSHQLLYQTILYQIKWAMQGQREKEAKLSKINYKTKLKELIINLIQNMLILKIMSGSQIVVLFQKIFVISQFDYLDKIEIMLAVKQLNVWTVSRIKTDKQKKHEQNQGQTDHQLIQVWCYKKCLILTELIDQYNWIAQYLKNSLKLNHKYLKNFFKQQAIFVSYLPYCLKIRFQLQMLHQQLMFFSGDSFNLILTRIYERISSQEKQKFSFFHFKIFQIYHTELLDIQKCVQISNVLQRNLNSQQMFSQMAIKYKTDFINYQNDSKFLQSVNLYMKSFSLKQLQTDISTLCSILMRMHAIKQNRRGLYKLTNQNRQLFGSILVSMRFLFNLITLPNYVLMCLHSPCILHHCFKYQLLRNLINIKKYYYRIINCQYVFKLDLDIVIGYLTYIHCKQCMFTMINFCLLGKQNYLVGQNTKQAEEEFMKNFQTLKKVNDQNSLLWKQWSDDNFQSINLSYMFAFCSKNQQYQNKYHGIQKLYQYIKQKKAFYFYFQLKYNCVDMIVRTMHVLYHLVSIHQFAFFLNALTTYIQNNCSLFSVHLLICAFQLYIRGKKDINYQVLFMQMEGTKLNNNIYNIIYYHESLFYIDANELLQKRIINNVRKCLDFLAWDIHLLYEAHIYRFLLFKNSIFRIYNRRKINYFKRKTIKLFNHFDSKPIKKIKIESNCYKMHFLQQKAIKLGGPFDMKLDGIRPIYIKPNLSKNY